MKKFFIFMGLLGIASIITPAGTAPLPSSSSSSSSSSSAGSSSTLSKVELDTVIKGLGLATTAEEIKKYKLDLRAQLEREGEKIKSGHPLFIFINKLMEYSDVTPSVSDLRYVGAITGSNELQEIAGKLEESNKNVQEAEMDLTAALSDEYARLLKRSSAILGQLYNQLENQITDLEFAGVEAPE